MGVGLENKYIMDRLSSLGQLKRNIQRMDLFKGNK